MSIEDVLLREARTTLIEGSPVRIANFVSLDPRLPDEEWEDADALEFHAARLLKAAVQSRAVPRARYTAPALVARTCRVLDEPRHRIAGALHELALGLVRRIALGDRVVPLGDIGVLVVYVMPVVPRAPNDDRGERPARRVVEFQATADLARDLRASPR